MDDFSVTIKMTESQVDRKLCTYPQNDRKKVTRFK